ncbi:NAD(P)-dependent dehydrogenase (short-subunit alcohol dehydrogenase family) [Saccharomonospora amisosensis]|uniref:NAD(P)-dependent dehydrogenase (Short-subunit alcohol dehydrogenase family) n=1 Tax=Saccharomonospora amisosensis TaxID=1128677 RepID=A0A7X5URS5_9PSEU|nr:SDR family oxidoreductase [Saccharomonospora amisosensis]NIJ12996.1 NAD(P)-dependent dehydrogenase (short-subunit alcohol dehydrogenase family) [Saccharomonospora amisosensis]
MVRDLTGKVALVTGGAHGVGRAVVDRLATRGAHVVINYLRAEEAAQRTLRELTARGHSAELIRCSVRRHGSISRMFDTVGERHARLDILVNNAASGAFGPIDQLAEKDWARAVDTNLNGTLWCSQLAAAQMSDGGAIVNLSSLGASLAAGNYAAIGTTKAAVEALTRYLAAEYGPRGIRVNTASAGPLEGEALRSFAPAAGVRKAIRAATPLGRLGTESELAEVVLFLVSSAASWVTGQVLVADGGLSLGTALFAGEPGG